MQAWLIGILTGFAEKMGQNLLTWLKAWVDKFRRDQKQKETGKKVEDNISQEKPRDEQTRKDEDDWINS